MTTEELRKSHGSENQDASLPNQALPKPGEKNHMGISLQRGKCLLPLCNPLVINDVQETVPPCGHKCVSRTMKKGHSEVQATLSTEHVRVSKLQLKKTKQWLLDEPQVEKGIMSMKKPLLTIL